MTRKSFKSKILLSFTIEVRCSNSKAKVWLIYIKWSGQRYYGTSSMSVKRFISICRCVCSARRLFTSTEFSELSEFSVA